MGGARVGRERKSPNSEGLREGCIPVKTMHGGQGSPLGEGPSTAGTSGMRLSRDTEVGEATQDALPPGWMISHLTYPKGARFSGNRIGSMRISYRHGEGDGEQYICTSSPSRDRALARIYVVNTSGLHAMASMEWAPRSGSAWLHFTPMRSGRAPMTNVKS